jgi:hypothetical protein
VQNASCTFQGGVVVQLHVVSSAVSSKVNFFLQQYPQRQPSFFSSISKGNLLSSAVSTKATFFLQQYPQRQAPFFSNIHKDNLLSSAVSSKPNFFFQQYLHTCAQAIDFPPYSLQVVTVNAVHHG